MKKEKFDIGNISDGGGFGMNLKRIGIIVGAHVVAIGVFYLAGSIGSSDDGGASTAGANGLKIWDSQSPNASDPTVDPSSMSSFDGRASDLGGYNGGVAQRPSLLANNSSSTSAPSSSTSASEVDFSSVPVISSGPRFEPQRPGESSQRGGSGAGNGRYSPAQSSNFGEPTLPPTMIKYTVAKGDSVWGIGQKFKVDSKDIVKANPGLEGGSIFAGQVLNVPKAGQQGSGGRILRAPDPAVREIDASIYVVKGGDSLSKIAVDQGTTLSALRAANGLDNDLIKVGQKIRIPNVSRKPSIARNQRSGTPVTVRSGDSISLIAQRHRISSRELMVYNDVKDARKLQVGQILYIPETDDENLREINRREQQAPPVRQEPVVTQPTFRPPPKAPPSETVRSQPTISFEDDSGIFEDDNVDAPVIPIEE